MMNIYLGKGVFYIQDKGQTIELWFDDTVCPMGSRVYNSYTVKDLPDIDVMYNIMVKIGYSQERIIDELLKIYYRYRNFKVDYLAESELTLGFIGYRGTGKSASIAKVVIEDFLLPGKRAWSNMPIEVEVIYREAKKVFRSEPVPKIKLIEGDDDIRNGVMVLDEVNMEVAEATRYMASTNLEFSNQLQMIRKKGLDVIWSAQNWQTVDARLRWQSDFIVLCSLKKPEHKGIFSDWRVMDSTGLSGRLDFDIEMRSHVLLDKIVQQGRTFIRPYWTAYDTHKLQGQEAYNLKELKKKESRYDEYFNDAVQFIAEGNTEVIKREYYQMKDIIDNRSEQTICGNAFRNAGFGHKQSWNEGYIWILKTSEKRGKRKKKVTV